MKKSFFLFICIVLNFNIILSQKIELDTTQFTKFDSINHKRIYEIGIIDYPLGFELIEMNNGDFVGNVKIALIRKEGKKSKEFITKISIDKVIVKKLMAKLNKIGIETIINCEENNDCVIGYDGSWMGFKIRTHSLNRKYLFWGLMLYYDFETEMPYNRKQAYKILKVLDKSINFKRTFFEVEKELSIGKYYYYFGGGAETSFEKK
ncbi:hypothetical protein LNQ49_16340 [Flavobacterium sp. F-65]|uniref:Uncharacterized protein n=1 Tax=Flavobacterium pisciphilum TaxID=2893755 RepID=A0ABS8MWK7_9FLAO|nr:hypothetical protein [Flavobacterium sp. F-65]MCC9073146.1 hypothetical protein [Flavobacterium sp. F-65]